MAASVVTLLGVALLGLTLLAMDQLVEVALVPVCRPILDQEGEVGFVELGEPLVPADRIECAFAAVARRRPKLPFPAVPKDCWGIRY
jgi:hypothetical protein